MYECQHKEEGSGHRQSIEISEIQTQGQNLSQPRTKGGERATCVSKRETGGSDERIPRRDCAIWEREPECMRTGELKGDDESDGCHLGGGDGWDGRVVRIDGRARVRGEETQRGRGRCE